MALITYTDLMLAAYLYKKRNKIAANTLVLTPDTGFALSTFNNPAIKIYPKKICGLAVYVDSSLPEGVWYLKAAG